MSMPDTMLGIRDTVETEVKIVLVWWTIVYGLTTLNVPDLFWNTHLHGKLRKGKGPGVV